MIGSFLQEAQSVANIIEDETPLKPYYDSHATWSIHENTKAINKYKSTE